MIDVKKLVTGFLILATIAVCSGLVLSLVANSSPQTAKAPAEPSITTLGSSGAYAQVPTTAFVDTGSLQGNAAELLSYVDTTSTDALASDPNNLTNIFADSFVKGLNAANPNGITTNTNGLLNIATPDTQAIAQTISSNPEVKGFVLPDWDTEAQSQLIKAAPSASQSAIAQYGTALSAAFNKDLVSSGLQNEINNAGSGDVSQLPYLVSGIQGALNDTLAIPTPAPLASLQQSFIRVMVYEKNFALLGEDSSRDPVKASLVFQGEKKKYDAAVINLQQQIEKASSLGLSLNQTPNTSVPLIAKLLGVQAAQAQWITFNPTQFAQMIEEYLNNIILQILKNVLVSLIQKKVLTAIQGHGAPKFVTSFAAQMVNSYQAAAMNTINADIAQTPPSQQSALRMLTSVSFSAPNAASVLGTLGANPAVASVPGFTNMGDYLSEFNTGGNIWANAMQIQDSALIAADNNQTAKQTQTVSQQGWNGDSTCPDGSDPQNGTHQVCAQGNLIDGECFTGNGSVGDHFLGDPENIPNGGLCPPTDQNPNGVDPTTIMPGQVTNQESNTALKTGAENITSANDIAGLLDALLTSLLNQLSQNAINLATSAVNGVINTQSPSNTGITGVASSSLTNTNNSSTATQAPVQCLPSIQTATISTSTGAGLAYVNMSATGGKIDTSCVTTNSCPSTENSDGTPLYNWTALGSIEGTGSGQNITLTYSIPGTYSVSVIASTDNSQSSCQIHVQ